MERPGELCAETNPSLPEMLLIVVYNPAIGALHETVGYSMVTED